MTYLRMLARWIRRSWHADLEFKQAARHRELVALVERSFAQAARQGNESSAKLAASIDALAARHADELARVDSRLSALTEWLGRLEADLATRQSSSEAIFDELKQHIGSIIAQSIAAGQQELSARVARVEAMLPDDRAERADVHADQPNACLPRPSRPPLGEEDYRRIGRQGLFVVGCARSGTTILADCLNLSPDVFMLKEAYFFDFEFKHAGQKDYDFVRLFNERHRRYGNLKAKGSYAPPCAVADRDCFDFLHRLGTDYRYVGDKLALGLYPCDTIPNWEQCLIEFQATHFYHSKHLIIIRKPAETIWSMRRMFPDISVARLIGHWLEVLRMELELGTALPLTRTLFLEDLSAENLRPLADWIGIEIPLPEGFLTRQYQLSLLGDGELPADLESHRAVLEPCQRLYKIVRDRFVPRALGAADGQRQRIAIEGISAQVTELLSCQMLSSQPPAELRLHGVGEPGIEPSPAAADSAESNLPTAA